MYQLCGPNFRLGVQHTCRIYIYAVCALVCKQSDCFQLIYYPNQAIKSSVSYLSIEVQIHQWNHSAPHVLCADAMYPPTFLAN
jgi:hypothetical protein